MHTADFEPVFTKCLQVRAACDEAHLVAGARQQPAEIPPYSEPNIAIHDTPASGN
jgi:hypothetical protein